MRAQPAAACAAEPCTPDQFVPRAGGVPANLTAIAWRPGHDYDSRDLDAGDTPVTELRLECQTPGEAPRLVALGAQPDQLSLGAALKEGERCELSDRRGLRCDVQRQAASSPELAYLAGRASFTVTAPAPLPKQLGRVALEPATHTEVGLSTSDGSCTKYHDACVVSGTLVWSAEAEPWRDALLFETTVDGQPWGVDRALQLPDELGALSDGRQRVLLFSLDERDSSSSRGLERGRHELRVRARLPGQSDWLDGEPATFELDCPQTPSAASDAGAPDAAAPDAAAPAGGGGCSVRATSGSCSPAWALLLVVVSRRLRGRQRAAVSHRASHSPTV
jgi:hypothetical protein